MSLLNIWRWFEGDSTSPGSRPHFKRSRPRERCRLAIQPLEERRLLSLSPVGAEFQVNTFTAGNQSAASMAMDADGDFVAVWQSNGQDGSGNGVYAQRYDAAGVPQGGEFRVNTSTAGSQSRPSVAMDSDGDFVIAWDTYQGSTFGSIYAQRYNAAGVPQGGEFRVNTLTTFSQDSASVAMDSDGNFVIAWHGSYFTSNAYNDVFAQRYNAAGVTQGSVFRANTYTSQRQSEPSLAMAASGAFVISWQSRNQGNIFVGSGIYAQRYDAAGVPQGGETLVNNVPFDDLTFPSAAMDADGNFVIAWNGYTTSLNIPRVYAQRFDAAGVPQGSRFLVNTHTAGSQSSPSVAIEGDGDFMIAWQSNGQAGGQTRIYAQRFSEEGVRQGGELQVSFSAGGSQTAPSLAVDADGDAVVAWQGLDGGGSGVSAQRFDNSASAVVDDSDAAGFGIVGNWSPFSAPGVGRNDNVHTAFGESSQPTDVATWTFNLGDGPGRYRVSATWFTNVAFSHLFTSAARYEVLDPAGRAIRGTSIINQKQFPDDFADAGSLWEDLGEFESVGSTLQVRLLSTADDQTQVVADAIRIEKLADLPPDLGPAVGPEFRVSPPTTDSRRFPSGAVDADGDFVIAWEGLDDDLFGVYAQRYNVAGEPQGGEFRVNTFTGGSQGNPTVAMAANGDFVIAWDSLGQPNLRNEIYSQRYNAAGVPQGGELRVSTSSFEHQFRASAAMDAEGNFVIAWHDSNEVFARRYNAGGVPQGGPFRANTSVIQGGQIVPSIAMNADGNFVVAWERDVMFSGYTDIYAQRYDAEGVPQGGEFRVNTFTSEDQLSPSVAIDTEGDFVITWTSYGTTTSSQEGSDGGVYAQRYNAGGVPQGAEFRVNTLIFAAQQRPRVAMAPGGDFVIAWESAYQDGDLSGVFAQRYNAAGEPIGSEFQVNASTAGAQRHVDVAMDAEGDFVMAWDHAADGGYFPQEIYAQRLTHLDADPDDQLSEAVPVSIGSSAAGMISDMSDVDLFSFTAGPSQTLGFDLDVLIGPAGGLDSLIRVFDSAGNQLTVNDNGAGAYPEVGVGESYLQVYFALAGTYYIGVSSPGNSDYDPLDGSDHDLGATVGSYTLTINLAPAIVPAGQEFRANTHTNSIQAHSSVAIDADGDFVVVWQSNEQDASQGFGVFAQRFNAAGAPLGSEFRVNTYTPSNQQYPRVAMDADGDFVIVWESWGQDGSGSPLGVYAQQYNSAGVPQGSEFRVNTFTTNNQDDPSVAMDPDGDFVIAWQSVFQDGSSWGVFAQRYNAEGVPQGNEFRVNMSTTLNQVDPSVAMDADGDFVIAWTSRNQSPNDYGVYVQRYNAAGVPQGDEFLVHDTFYPAIPSAAMDADGNFIITWNGDSGYAQLYDAAGVPQGSEFLVGSGRAFRVAIDADGDFLITWMRADQDGSLYGIYARRYNAAGAPQGDEFLVNTFTYHNQIFPSVAMNADGDAVVAWHSYGQDGSHYGVYAQRFTQVSNVAVIDNSDTTGFGLSGEWALGGGPGVGRNNTVLLAFDESHLPTDTATWTFNLPGPGRYRVSATWFTNTGFPHLFSGAARYEVSDSDMGAVRGTALVNQKVFPNDFTDAGSAWEDLGVFDVVGSTLVVRLFSSGDNQTYVVADAIRVEKVGDVSATAEIQVTENGFDIPDNTGNVSFGTADLADPLDRVFEISNLGFQPLHLTLPVTVPGGFSLVSPPELTTLNPGQTTTFVLRLDATLPGFYSGQVSFGNDDGDEDPFNFTINGSVLPTKLIDDGDPGFTMTPLGAWGSNIAVGFQSDYRYTRLISGNDLAAWTFDVTPGQYRVSATWLFGYDGFDDTAPFTVFDGAVSRGGRDLNQKNAPNDRTFAGASFEDVGVFNILGDTLSVQLRGDHPVWFVLADAVLIERLGDVPPGPEIAVLDGNRDVTLSPISFGTVEFSHPADKTFTITNSGSADLDLTAAITVPAGYTLLTPPAGALPSGQSISFVVRLVANLPGVHSGQVTVPSNDADENPLTFAVTGTVLATQILDDGQPGYSHSGGFHSEALSVARDGDNSFSVPQSPPSEAVWTFSVTPGQYTISATWFNTAGTGTLFASNARFTVFDGATPLGTFLLNQRQGPNDFTADGSTWESIGGTFDITGSTLVVRLSNVGANGYLLADAIRLLFLGSGNANSESGGDAAALVVRGSPDTVVVRGSPVAAPPVDRRSPGPRDEETYGRAGRTVGRPFHNEVGRPFHNEVGRPFHNEVGRPSHNEWAYWTDDLDDVATLLADDSTREQDDLSDQLAAAGRVDDFDDVRLDPDVTDWLE